LNDSFSQPVNRIHDSSVCNDKPPLKDFDGFIERTKEEELDFLRDVATMEWGQKVACFYEIQLFFLCPLDKAIKVLRFKIELYRIILIVE
jgi:hypothetical protein